MTDEKSTAVKVIVLTAASLALLSACGEPKATPMDDEYAGNSGESVESQEDKSKTDGKATDNSSNDDDSVKNHADDSNSTKSDKKDTGNYADGTYSINGQYGPVGEDTIDVHLTVKDQNVDRCEHSRPSVHVHLQKASGRLRQGRAGCRWWASL